MPVYGYARPALPWERRRLTDDERRAKVKQIKKRRAKDKAARKARRAQR